MTTTKNSVETEFVSILGSAEKTDVPKRVSSRSLPETLPVLGLSDIVIFPGAVVPLLVETGPSLKLVDDLVAGDRLFAAVLQINADVPEPGPDDLHKIGCVSRLNKMVKFPDGTVRILVEGLWRIKLDKFQPPSPYLRAHFELLRDEAEDSVELQAMLRNAHKQFEEIAKISTILPDQVKLAALNTEHPGHFADLIAANLGLPLDDKQKLLEIISVRERLKKLLPLLNREQEVLTLSSKIQNDVASNIAKTQRDFFLREQLRAIQRELGESDPNAGENPGISAKAVELALLPDEVLQSRQSGTRPDAAERRPPPPNTAASRAIISTGFWRCLLADLETPDKLDLEAGGKKFSMTSISASKRVKDRLLVISRRAHSAAKRIKGPILLPRQPRARRRQNHSARQKRGWYAYSG